MCPTSLEVLGEFQRLDQQSLQQGKKRGIVSEFLLVVLRVPHENRMPEPIKQRFH